MPDIKVRVGQQNAVKVVASAFGGSLTAENAVNATNVLGGIASVTQLDVSPGISTFAGAVGLSSNLYVAGISTFAANGGITTTGGDLYVGGDLFVLDDITLDEVNLRNLNVTGISTLGITSATWLEAQQLNVTGVSTFVGLSTFSGDVVFQGAIAAQNMTWDASENDLEFTDLARIKFGNSDDLEIWHGSGNNSHIKNSTNDLKIRSDSLILKRADDSEAYLKATVNEDVKLYYNGNEKFATISTGATVTGDLYVGGDLYLGDDLVLDNITGNSLNITGLSTFVGNAQFDGNVSVGGTLTYEDVTNVDSIGIVTAGQGLRATTGGLVVTAGISTFDADLQVAGNIRHKGDGDTYIEFTGDQIRLIAGGKPLIHAEEGTPSDTVIINDGGNDLDFRVEGHDDEYQIFSDGLTNMVGIGSAIPTAKLDVTGSTNISGTLTAGLIDGGSY